ncbi:GNAT family N-acetyltransferase [Streptomyces sp. NPDC020192]|uniref:GNAT family N-acetyltransferase n=1 Tax=Streptomyces sp. NPDC020192 TaxID=3365066 RepID=UPI0037A0E22E
MTIPIELRHFGHADLSAIRQTLLNVHADVYADEMDDEFNQCFPWFTDHWGSTGYACVIGYDGGEPVGFAYGAPATPGREWWRERESEPPADDSTFSVSELVVRPRRRKTGTAERLHAVQALYEAWGYTTVGRRQPFPDSPNHAVTLRHLVPAFSGSFRTHTRASPRGGRTHEAPHRVRYPPARSPSFSGCGRRER